MARGVPEASRAGPRLGRDNFRFTVAADQERRPAKLPADKGYDYSSCRRMLRRRGSTPRIARRGVESSTRLGRHRWKVERSLAWLLANRRLMVRDERRADILQAFLHVACALVWARRRRPVWTSRTSLIVRSNAAI